MDGDSRAIKIQQCDKIVQELGSTSDVIACIFVLPGCDNYAKSDPKQVLHNAFARTGRVIQFIPASNEPRAGMLLSCIWRMPRGSNTPQFAAHTSLMPRSLLWGL